MIRAWLIVFICSIMIMLGAGPVYYAYGNYAVAFKQEFAAPITVVNIGFTMVGIMGNLGSAPVGMALDRWGVRTVASVSVIGTALGFVLVSISTSIWQIVFLFGTLIAMADIGIGVVSTSYLVTHWFDRRRGLALGLSVLGASAAAVVFPPLTDFLISTYGWRGTFLIYALLLLLLLPAIWLFVEIPHALPPQERMNRYETTESGPLLLGEMFRHGGFWILSLASGIMIGANTGTMVSLVSFAKSRGLETADGSLLLSTVGICAIAGKIMIGFGIDRLSRQNALFLGVGCQLCGMLLLLVAPGFITMVLAVGVFGLGVGAMLPVWSASMASLFGLARYGRVLGWSRAVMTPIAMIFPILAGLIFDQFGDYFWAWASFAALLCAAMASIFALPRVMTTGSSTMETDTKCGLQSGQKGTA